MSARLFMTSAATGSASMRGELTTVFAIWAILQMSPALFALVGFTLWCLYMKFISKRGLEERNRNILENEKIKCHLLMLGGFGFLSDLSWTFCKTLSQILITGAEVSGFASCRSEWMQWVSKTLQFHLQKHRGELPVFMSKRIHPARRWEKLQR